jgi:hypothetical protein
LQVQPARSDRNEDLLYPRVLLQPFPDRWAFVAGEVVSYEVKIAARIRLLDGFEESQEVAFGVARAAGEREGSPVAHSQRSVDPDLLGTPRLYSRGALMR